MDKWDRGFTIRLLANPDYFGGAPKIKEVYLKPISDGNVSLMALMTKTIDFALIGTSQINQVEEEGLAYHVVPAYSFKFITFNTTKHPFNDLRMRQAIALATDRETLMYLQAANSSSENPEHINEKIRMTGTIIDSPFQQGFSITPDLNKARILIDQTGYFK